MYYLSCIFEIKGNKSKPIYAASYNKENKEIKFYQLYKKGTKTPLYDIKKNEEEFVKLINNEDIVLSKFNDYIRSFNLDVHRQYDVYDVNNGSLSNVEDESIEDIKKRLIKDLSSIVNCDLNEWQQYLAYVQLVYCFLEKEGFYLNGQKKYLKYELAYTGRSKCLMNNIQGASVEDQVHHCDYNNEVFVHLDWIAADFRIASIISRDKILRKTFKNSDPYQVIIDELGSDEISRERCKSELFRSLYSMDYSSDILSFYPDFSKWMCSSAKKIENNNYGESILGRKFYISDTRGIKSVFNAQIQGSVAHGMHNVLYRVFKLFPNNILTEVHDSLILCCNKKDLKTIINEVSNIMLFPFDGLLEENPKFPLKVSIGMEWKKWKVCKEFR